MGRKRDDDAEDLIRLYLSDIGSVDLLTKDDEVDLSRRIETGREAHALLEASKSLPAARRRELERKKRDGAQAEADFVQANLRLVVSIAKRYQASGVPLLDLIQEGNFGLMHAVEKFDWRKGFKFSTYATWWIRQAITRGIANTGRTIRLPAHAADLANQLTRARNVLEGQLGRPPTILELSEEMHLTPAKVEEVVQYVAEPVSIHETVRSDSDTELAEVIEDHHAPSAFDAAFVTLMPVEVAKLLSGLDAREREVLTLRFGLDRGEPRTLDDVGEWLNLGRERIRQIESRALAKLRHPSGESGAGDLLSA